jgi:penicillin amidase
VDSRAAAIYYVWYEQMRAHVGADEFGGRFVWFPRYALDRILDEGDGAWVDEVRTTRRETLAEMSNVSMREAIRMVGGRAWGEIHTTRIAHALGSVDLVARALGLNAPAFPAPGSPNTVNVAGYGRLLPFVSTYGASMRHVVDLADPDGAGGFVLPTGQSGIPLSPHYADQTVRWREGRLWPIPLDRARAERAAVSRVTLGP